MIRWSLQADSMNNVYQSLHEFFGQRKHSSNANKGGVLQFCGPRGAVEKPHTGLAISVGKGEGKRELTYRNITLRKLICKVPATPCRWIHCVIDGDLTIFPFKELVNVFPAFAEDLLSK